MKNVDETGKRQKLHVGVQTKQVVKTNEEVPELGRCVCLDVLMLSLYEGWPAR